MPSIVQRATSPSLPLVVPPSPHRPRRALTPAMAISAFFVLNLKGEVLISRLFRPDLKFVPAHPARHPPPHLARLSLRYDAA